MRTFVIGDVHGCLETFEALLARCRFRPKKDRLWLVGDLVNRGPESLETLRRARALSERMGERFRMVLGNHDLHALAVARGVARGRKSDTLDQLLAAEDRKVLLRWLARRPLIHREDDVLLVHAGLPPHWSFGKCERRARRAERWLRGGKRRQRAAVTPTAARARELAGAGEVKRLEKDRAALVYLTRLRSCGPRGGMHSYSGPPKGVPKGYLPWFRYPRRERDRDVLVLYGHWAAQGLAVRKRSIGLDSGCAWGRRLTALRLEDGEIIQQKNLDLG